MKATPIEYLDAVKRYADFVIKNGKEPTTLRFRDTLVAKPQYTDALMRLFVWLDKNQKLPNTLTINVPDTPAPSNKSKLYQDFVAVVGRFANATELYRLMGKFHYLYYENDRYSDATVLDRMRRGIGNNCVDLCQLTKKILEEDGYTVQFVHGQVRCSNLEWYGHIWLRVRGKEFANWINYDLVSAVKQSYPLGTLCCVGGIRGPHNTANLVYYNEIPASWKTY